MAEFQNCEREALEVTLAMLEEKEGATRETIVSRVQAKLEERQEKLSPKDLDERNYCYVVVHRNKMVGDKGFGKVSDDDTDDWLPWVSEEFLVASPYKERALVLAKRYVASKGWTLHGTEGGKKSEDDFYSLYPRNYIRKARSLFNQGCYM